MISYLLSLDPTQITDPLKGIENENSNLHIDTSNCNDFKMSEQNKYD